MIYLRNATDWSVRAVPTATPRAARRGGDAAPRLGIPTAFLPQDAAVAGEFVASPQPRVTRRGGSMPALDFEADCAADELMVVIARHPSGALTFHASKERITGLRGTKRSGGRVRFVLPQPGVSTGSPDQPVRRGLISQAIHFALVKLTEAVVDKVVSATSSVAIQGIERGWWSVRGMKEGWCQVTAEGLRQGRLPAIAAGDVRGNGRALLLLHGTFSHAASAFKGLSSDRFLGPASSLYGKRIFAFNHFTLSKSPEENVSALLKTLPAGGLEFDVITHSRGGLVLRHLVERPDLFGAAARRFRLGHAVLVASPNAGTPWVTPGRWEETLGLVANLLEALPIDNPWTDGASFLAHGLTWLASHVAGDWAGLASMDANGTTITELQQPPGPAADAYSALVANSHPTGQLLARWLDAGLDRFFAGANDLVVPSEGGWRVDASEQLAIPPERVGSFGPGGNLATSQAEWVHHLNFFSQPESIDFILRALRRSPQGLSGLELDRALPTRKLFRGQSKKTGIQPLVSQPAPPTAPSPQSTTEPVLNEMNLVRTALANENQSKSEALSCSNEFHLLILHGSQGARETQILASYRNARVLEPFATRNFKEATRSRGASKNPPTAETPAGAASAADALAGTRFQHIIKVDRSIHDCMAGDATAAMPAQEELEQLGRELFEALFPGNVRRLYDVARSESRSGWLSVILTCTVPWLAALPWEFALDPSRRKFLATEEIHFIRNVLTAVPAQHVPLRRRLRLLVVAASPQDVPELSEQEEADKIRRGFKALIDAGLADVDVLTDATPATLHERTETRSYDVVHFIGHGDFDKEAHRGVLLFETSDGGQYRAGTRTLREILCGRGIQLIFLNACESGRDDYGSRNRGVAQALIEGGIPAVVANQYPVLDPSAVAFAEHFYWSLGHGAALGEAARESRIAVNYSREGEMIDWAVPVLFARDPEFRLCEPSLRQLSSPTRREPLPALLQNPASKAAPTPAAFPPGSTQERRSKRAQTKSPPPLPVRKRRRVAVADLSHLFPALPDTLDRLNAAQEVFDFVSVEITVPLCAWSLHPMKPNGSKESYLYADRFAKQLSTKPRELGASFLACITHRPMVCDTSKGPLYNVYAWWPDPAAEPIEEDPLLIFSTYGFTIPPQGPITDRVLTNGFVTCLAGSLLHTDTHEHGPKDCPLYLNPERDFAHLAGSLRFHDGCRKKLAAKYPLELQAFDALLTVCPEA